MYRKVGGFDMGGNPMKGAQIGRWGYFVLQLGFQGWNYLGHFCL